MIERQLLTGGAREPTFIPPKRGAVRGLDLSEETVLPLKAHKRTQAEEKIANRTRTRTMGWSSAISSNMSTLAERCWERRSILMVSTRG